MLEVADVVDGRCTVTVAMPCGWLVSQDVNEMYQMKPVLELC